MIKSFQMRSTSLAVSLTLLLCTSQLSASEGAKSLTIPSQSLATALHQLASAMNVQLDSAKYVIPNKTSQALQGEYTLQSALDTLLENSGITYTINGNEVILSQTAQTNDKGTNLQALVVTASGSAVDISEAPASISVISSEEIQKTPVHDLRDILSDLEGVSVSGSGNYKNVYVRGLSDDYVLKLIDGKRISSTTAVFRGNTYDTGWVPTEAIERIEVVRGPMSSLYGSDAIGGVINIITKKIDDEWRGSITVDQIVQEDDEYGDSRKVNAYVGGPLIKDVLGLRIYGSDEKRDADGAVNSNGLAGQQENKSKTLSTQLKWTPNDINELSFTYDMSDREFDGGRLERDGYALAHNGYYDFGNSEVKIFRDEIQNKIGNVSGYTNPNKATNTDIDGKFVLPADSINQIFTFGGEYRLEELHDPYHVEVNDIEVSQIAAFIEDEISLLENLSLTLGNRLDNHENFGTHNSPRAYVVYHPINHVTIKGGIATAFKAPTLLQNSPEWGTPSCGSATAGCWLVGSEDLKPETSVNKEIGIMLTYDRWGGGATIYENEIEDMINIDNRTTNLEQALQYDNFVGYTEDGRLKFEYRNLEKVRIRGLELNAHALLTDTLKLKANYTYSDAKNLSGSKELPLTYRPENSAHVSLDWLVKQNLTLSTEANYVGRQYIIATASNTLQKDTYTTVDFSASYDLNKDLTVRGGILNLFDKEVEREVSSDYNEDGRRYFVSMTAKY